MQLQIQTILRAYYFCHLHVLSLSLTLSPPAKELPNLSLNILLADKYQEHEEASEKVEAVNDSEEDLKIAIMVFTGNAIMVSMDEIVEAGEDPGDAQNGEQFAVQTLKNENSVRFYNAKLFG